MSTPRRNLQDVRQRWNSARARAACGAGVYTCVCTRVCVHAWAHEHADTRTPAQATARAL